MESLFSTIEPPLAVRVMSNPTWPLLTEEARMEKLRTLLFQDLHEQEGGGDSGHNSSNSHNNTTDLIPSLGHGQVGIVEQEPVLNQANDSCERANTCTTPSRYESQKRRDWNTFRLYLKNHRLELHQCSGAHVLEFLRYLDQFGKTKVHLPSCNFYGVPNPPHPCRCPLRQAWGSLDALIGRLRAAFEEHGGKPESNPFGARLVRLYLREVREAQAKARGVAYGKKKRKCSPPSTPAGQGVSTSSNGSAEQSEQRPPSPLPPRYQPQQAYDRQPHDQQGVPQHSEYSVGPIASDPHPLNAYSPNSNPLIKPAAMSSFRPPLSFHSFLDDLPGRRAAAAAGWGCGTLYSR